MLGTTNGFVTKIRCSSSDMEKYLVLEKFCQVGVNLVESGNVYCLYFRVMSHSDVFVSTALGFAALGRAPLLIIPDSSPCKFNLRSRRILP